MRETKETTMSLTEIADEIRALLKSPFVRLGIRARALKRRCFGLLKTLRAMEIAGRELDSRGITEADLARASERLESAVRALFAQDGGHAGTRGNLTSEQKGG